MIFSPPSSPQPLRCFSTALCYRSLGRHNKCVVSATIALIRLPLGRHDRCEVSAICFVAPLVATAAALFQHIFLLTPRSPQPLLSFNQFLFFLAAPAPPARSPQTCSFSTFHCFRPVLGRHISQPPPAQDSAVSIVLSAPFGRHNYFVVSTHVFVSHLLVATAAAYFQHICLFRPSWSPQPLRSI